MHANDSRQHREMESDYYKDTQPMKQTRAQGHRKFLKSRIEGNSDITMLVFLHTSIDNTQKNVIAVTCFIRRKTKRKIKFSNLNYRFLSGKYIKEKCI